MKKGDCVVAILIGYEEMYFNFKDNDRAALTFMRTAADTLVESETIATIGMEIKTKETNINEDTDV